MDLVFFDIECASVNKTVAKICAFGYVICDEQFHIRRKKDILINPRGKFRLTDRKGDKGIVLPYDYDSFIKYPRFSKIYPFIKTLLENPNNIVIGHSTVNDVKYLNLETKRFSKESFNFEFSDSQLLYMTARNDFSRQFGLEHIANDLGVEFTPHRAADDAYATMRVVEALCKEQNCGYRELVTKLNIQNGSISNYKITLPSSLAKRTYEEKIRKERRDRARKHTQFCRAISRRREIKDAKLRGKNFTFSRELERDLEVSVPLLEGILSHGGVYTQHLTRCKYYIVKDVADETPRTKLARGMERLSVNDVSWLESLLND